MKTLKGNHLERVDMEKEKLMYSAMFYYEQLLIMNMPKEKKRIL